MKFRIIDNEHLFSCADTPHDDFALGDSFLISMWKARNRNDGKVKAKPIDRKTTKLELDRIFPERGSCGSYLFIYIFTQIFMMFYATTRNP